MSKKAEKKVKVPKTQKSILPGAMLVSLIAALIVFVVMINAEKNALASYEKGVMLTAKTDIPNGEMISEDNYNQYFEKKEIEATLIPEKAVTDPKELYGRIAGNDIDTGAMITESMFAEIKELVEGIKSPVLAGLKADDLYQAVGGILRAGDRINIYTIDENTSEAVLAWKDVYVQQVFDASGNIIAGSDKITAAQRFNIFLEESRTEEFYTLLSQGTLRVVKIWN